MILQSDVNAPTPSFTLRKNFSVGLYPIISYTEIEMAVTNSGGPFVGQPLLAVADLAWQQPCRKGSFGLGNLP
jgi:hypothetical protein